MFHYNILNNQSLKPNKKIIDKIFEKVFNIIEKKQNWTLNLVFVDDDSIKKLNNDYRKINKITDVLSFHYFDNFDNLKKDDIAWEIIFNYNRIKSQALEQNHSEEKEFYILLIHSILHILWYDHEKDSDYTIMNEFEKRIYQEVFEKE